LRSATGKAGHINALDLPRQATGWLSRFGAALARRDLDAALKLFGAECYWRDLAALTWNIKTCEGREAIRAMLEATLVAAAPAAWAADGTARASDGVVESWFEEPGYSDNCETDPYGESAPQTVLQKLAANVANEKAA